MFFKTKIVELYPWFFFYSFYISIGIFVITLLYYLTPNPTVVFKNKYGGRLPELVNIMRYQIIIL